MFTIVQAVGTKEPTAAPVSAPHVHEDVWSDSDEKNHSSDDEDLQESSG